MTGNAMTHHVNARGFFMNMRMSPRITAVGLCTALLFSCSKAEAQHLWWSIEKQGSATCLYGEITVFATHPSIYYCGANWHPGEPAGGYCGMGTAALIGVAVPNLLHRLELDPQVAAGPIALAAADMLTLLIYFNLARWLLA